MDQQIWQWTLTKEAIAPCFVRDVLDMRRHKGRDVDFFWLGHTPCRTVLLVGMVVAVQQYDKRAIYTIDDGTAVVDCVLRHPRPAPGADTVEPPPPVTEPGYPVRVVGKVIRHYQSKQIDADTIDPCPSSLDEIAHLERVIELHRSKYSRAVPFVPPVTPALRPDTCMFSGAFPPPRPGVGSSYTLPAPPLPLQSRNQSHPLHPQSPAASSIASSTPSSPCKPSSPVKAHEIPQKPKLRHPSRLHTRDLTANTFRIYVKHYMDNAPPPFLVSCPSPSRSTCGVTITPTKCVRDEDEDTPRPFLGVKAREIDTDDEDAAQLGFTLSHLRRVPELALLAARVVRAETRRRDRIGRGKEQANSHSCITSSIPIVVSRPNGRGEGKRSTPAVIDPPRKKMKRLFSWAVVKLHEEGSIILWDGDVRPLPVPPPPILEESSSRSGLWKRDDTMSLVTNLSLYSASELYSSSASAPLYSHYHEPRRPAGNRYTENSERNPDADEDPGCLSDPPADEEAYIPLTPRFLMTHVRDTLGVMCRRGNNGARGGGTRKPTAEDILSYMRRSDTRWARLGVWVVEEALVLLKAR